MLRVQAVDGEGKENCIQNFGGESSGNFSCVKLKKEMTEQ
jgi:hypothetical protein